MFIRKNYAKIIGLYVNYFKELILLAQIKRKKVSTAAAAKQKKNLLKNKKFWIISSIVAAIVIAAAIVIPIVVINATKGETEHTDYFKKGTTYSYKDTDVSFTKANYEGIIMHTSELDFESEEGFTTYQKHIFYFAYDLSKFYPDTTMDTDDEKLYNSVHKEALESMKKLQYEINKYNNEILNDSNADNDEDVAYLYVVDLGKASNKSLTSSSYASYFGGTGAEDFIFGYIAGVDKLKKTFEYDDKDHSIFTTNMNEFNTTICDTAIEFMNDYNFRLSE